MMYIRHCYKEKHILSHKPVQKFTAHTCSTQCAVATNLPGGGLFGHSNGVRINRECRENQRCTQCMFKNSGSWCGVKMSELADAAQALRHLGQKLHRGGDSLQERFLVVAATIFLLCLVCIHREKVGERGRGREGEGERERERGTVTKYCTPDPCLLHVQYEGNLYCTVTLSPLLRSHWTSGLPVFACSSIGVIGVTAKYCLSVVQGEPDLSAGKLSLLVRPGMCGSNLSGCMKDPLLKGSTSDKFLFMSRAY